MAELHDSAFSGVRSAWPGKEGSDHDCKVPGSPAQAPPREEAVVMSREREREPHPDPAIELQLQEILDLRASIDRRTALMEQYREEIADLHKDARYNDDNERTKILYERADQLDEKIRALEGDIEPVHERIRELQGKISSDDLAFLGS
jgi:predicted  nucleic acid-binding Zn-ribbon protein